MFATIKINLNDNNTYHYYHHCYFNELFCSLFKFFEIHLFFDISRVSSKRAEMGIKLCRALYREGS